MECGHRQCKACIDKVEGSIIKCGECYEETSKNEMLLDRGLRNDMKSLSISCSLCEWSGLFQNYEEHLNQQRQNPICRLCNQTFNSIMRLNEHQQNECTQIIVSCSLKDYGCLHSVYRVELFERYLTDVHQRALMTAACRMRIRISHEQSGTSSLTTTNENLSNQMRKIYETINILASGIQTLNADIQRRSNDSIRLQTSIESLSQEFLSLKLSIDEQCAFLDEIKSNQRIHQQNIASLKKND